MTAKMVAFGLAIVLALMLIPRMVGGSIANMGKPPPPPPSAPKQSAAEKAREWIGVVSGGIAAIGSAFGGFSRAPSSNVETIQV